MSKRRRAGDWVYMVPSSGFIGNSHEYRAEIMPEDDAQRTPCFLCDEEKCREWNDLWSEPRADGSRIPFYHVSECQMLDGPWEDDDDD